jgi:hypothetical protein
MSEFSNARQKPVGYGTGAPHRPATRHPYAAALEGGFRTDNPCRYTVWAVDESQRPQRKGGGTLLAPESGLLDAH